MSTHPGKTEAFSIYVTCFPLFHHTESKKQRGIQKGFYKGVKKKDNVCMREWFVEDWHIEICQCECAEEQERPGEFMCTCACAHVRTPKRTQCVTDSGAQWPI